VAEQNNFRVLHLSDIHFDQAHNKAFHEEMKAYIIENFDNVEGSSKKIDYLVVSGDFGDKCLPKNVQEVTAWLVDIRDSLKLRSNQIVLTAGNHDITAQLLPELHQDIRLQFEEARNYVTNQGNPRYERRVFNCYQWLKKNLLGEDNPQVKKNGLSVMDDDPRVRFIIINSSWLSQYKKTKRYDRPKGFQEKMSDKTDDETIEKLLEEFQIACSQDTSPKSEESILVGTAEVNPDIPKKRIQEYKNTLNYSENIRQQLGLTNEEMEELSKVKRDNKLNIIVFHHPENHLHAFERQGVQGILESGRYRMVVEKGDILICGHIHPSQHIKIIDPFKQMPAFTGGAAHIAKNVPANPQRPLFYHYHFYQGDGMFDNEWHSNSWWCEPTSYFKDGENSPIEKILINQANYPDDPKQTAIPLRIKRSEPESGVGELANHLVLSDVHIPSERAYLDLQRKIAEWLKNEFVKLTGQNGIKVTENPWKLYVAISNKPPYYKLVKFPVLTLEKDGTTKQVIWDVIYSCEIAQKAFIQKRLETLKRSYIYKNDKNHKTIDKKDVYYVPVIVDLIAALTKDEMNRIEYMRMLIGQTRIIVEAIGGNDDTEVISPVYDVFSKGFSLPDHNPDSQPVAFLGLLNFIGSEVIQSVLESKIPENGHLLPGFGKDFQGLNLFRS
jgi:predicted MPP superfamily phosphohydrolase